MKNIICFGDSNTYGYDPTGANAFRYPAEVRWVDTVAREAGYNLINYGLNGRCIPTYPRETDISVELIVSEANKYDSVSIWIMLGTNDIVMNPGKAASEIAEDMARYVAKLKEGLSVSSSSFDITILSAPALKRGFWVPADSCLRVNTELVSEYQKLSQKLNLGFIDTTAFGLELTADGTHFTEEDHQRFAKGILENLKIV